MFGREGRSTPPSIRAAGHVGEGRGGAPALTVKRWRPGERGGERGGTVGHARRGEGTTGRAE